MLTVQKNTRGLYGNTSPGPQLATCATTCDACCLAPKSLCREMHTEQMAKHDQELVPHHNNSDIHQAIHPSWCQAPSHFFHLFLQVCPGAMDSSRRSGESTYPEITRHS